jgi:hypothetical protein
MTRQSWPALVLTALFAVSLQAHVGSPDVYLEGKAGPYRLWVTIRPPEVIPGVAAIEVRADAQSLTRLEVTPIPLARSGTELAPVPDVLKASVEDPEFYTGSIWMMRPGSWQIRLHASGSKGEGTLAVPVPAMAMRMKGMQRSMGLALFTMMSTLVVGLIAIAGASAGEATLAPGTLIDPSRRRKSAVSMVLTALAVLGILAYGRNWWNQSEAEYGGNIYKAMQLQVTLKAGVLSLQMSDPGWLPLRKIDDLILDHNHLMHLYAIRQPGLDVVFHLHPESSGPSQFRLPLPEMPPGTYRLYADIVHENGFPETLTSSLTIAPGDTTKRPLAGDDAAGVASSVENGSELGASFHLPDGCSMTWLDSKQPLRARQLHVFRFRLLDPHGQAARDMQLYMGMLGHAAFVKTDFTTFAHIHPDGSANMAAYMMAQNSTANLQTTNAQMNSMGDMPGMNAGSDMMMDPKDSDRSRVSNQLPNEVSFPYGFPQSGRYRLFVQVRRGDTIETATFDAKVQ